MRLEPESYPWERRLGAAPAGDGRVELRVWAPDASREVAALVDGTEHPLEPEGAGMWAARVPAGHGARYGFLLHAGADPLPDPCSRWQPDGLRGPSAVVDHTAFAWTDDAFVPAPLARAVLYELHVGTFTPEGTFDAAIDRLDGLAELGITHLELMPVAEFPGERGWGYDGVYLSAAQSSYGGPEGLQRLVDAAHACGLGVVLDVVYNHLGASGVQAIEAYGPYFTAKYDTFWGKALNYDDEHCDPVREWVLQSAEGWVRDFHLDGLRLDAIHAIYDASANPLLRTLAERVRAARPHAVVIAESGRNDPAVMRPASQGGLGHDAEWADDFHHALRVLLTGDREGYYEEFGTVAALAKCLGGRPHFHDGQYSTFRKKRFGAPADDVAPEAFVVFSANHDQVGNRALGDRLPRELRPLAALVTLLSPFTPMIFMGDEHADPAPFQFFSDHIDEEIATATRDGRRREFAAFAAFAGEEVPDPQARETFEASKLTWEQDAAVLALHRELLRLRAELTGAPVDGLEHSEEGWLRFRRGPVEVCANLTAAPLTLEAGGDVALAAGEADRVPEGLRLGAHSGAVLRT